MTADKKRQDAFDDDYRFLVRLGSAAHGYGSTAARLEIFLSALTSKLGYRGVFRSTPSEVVFAVQEEEEGWQRTHIAALPAPGLELNRLAEVGGLVDEVVAGRVSISEGTRRLDEIDKVPHPWGNVASAASYAFAGIGFAMLMSGGWWDVVFSALFSLGVFGMVASAGRFGARTAAWLPLSTAFVAGVLAAGTKIVVPEVNLVLVTLSAILILIPGYSISVGVVELVSQHTASGWANLLSGLVYLAKQFAGAWLGVSLVALVASIPQAAAGSPVDSQWLWAAIPLLIVSLCVAFQTSLRDFVPAALVCAAAYGGIVFGSDLAGSNLGNLLGTVTAVVLANLWAGRTGRPTSIVLLPAIVLLVSGSIGFRGLAAIAVGDVAAGEQQFLQMFVVALTIAAGLLVGNTIARPRVTL